MSKKNDITTPLSIELINNGIHAMAIGAHTDLQISREEAFDFFASAEDNAFETLGGGQYWDWDKVDPGKYVFIFTGTTEWEGIDKQTQQKKKIPAVKLEGRDGTAYICAGKLLVDNMAPIQQVPCMVRIVYAGKKKASNGNNYYDLSVQVGREVLKPAL